MTATVRRWVQTHRYEETVRQLQALSAAELQALGITPSQIEHLALQATRT
jgi:uncharacterized protein YjiS (DUF1127 family)